LFSTNTSTNTNTNSSKHSSNSSGHSGSSGGRSSSSISSRSSSRSSSSGSSSDSSGSSTTTTKDIDNINRSKRQQFRDIVPDKRTLDYLDRLGLGYLTKRQQRMSIAKKFSYENRPKPRPNDQLSIQNLGPYPFDKVGKVITKVSSFNDVQSTTWIYNKSNNNIKILYEPPEVAIIGRSNVGKSTLLNRLVGFDDSFVQSSPVSEKPGETQELHFYGVGRVRVTAQTSSSSSPPSSSPPPPSSSISSSRSSSISSSRSSSSSSSSSNESYNVLPALVIVDMPGYGFAFMNEEDKVSCDTLCCQYLLQRGKALKKVILLVDARHGLKVTDKLFFQTLMKFHNSNNNDNKKNDKIKWTLQVVFTKCDLVERMELVRRIQLTRETLDDILPRFSNSLHTLAVSSKENKGIIEIQKELISLIPSVMPVNHHHWYARTTNNNDNDINKDNTNKINNKGNSTTSNGINKHTMTSSASRNHHRNSSSSLRSESKSLPKRKGGFLMKKRKNNEKK
jgi:GTP-binding protein